MVVYLCHVRLSHDGVRTTFLTHKKGNPYLTLASELWNISCEYYLKKNILVPLLSHEIVLFLGSQVVRGDIMAWKNFPNLCHLLRESGGFLSIRASMWWRHPVSMSPFDVISHHKEQMMCSVDTLLAVLLNKLLNKKSNCPWFQTQWRS